MDETNQLRRLTYDTTELAKELATDLAKELATDLAKLRLQIRSSRLTLANIRYRSAKDSDK